MIETKQLTHIYPKTNVEAVSGVDLSIGIGEVVGIIGQNGSGKTTLVRHLNGLLKPTTGKVLLEGKDTEDMKMGDMAKHVGYVFQNPNHQIFCATVEAEMLVAPTNFGFTEDEKKKALERVVELLGLQDLLKKHPLLLDYTTKKILAIASVLIYSPSVLIMDEPTGGLDEPGRELLSNIMKITHEEGHTVVIISHDMDYIAENTNRVVVMANGKILKDDEPAAVFADEAVLKAAWIEPPQITQLDMILGPGEKLCMSVDEFIAKRKAEGK